jgi:hypothetical protein
MNRAINMEDALVTAREIEGFDHVFSLITFDSLACRQNSIISHRSELHQLLGTRNQFRAIIHVRSSAESRTDLFAAGRITSVDQLPMFGAGDIPHTF